MEESKKEIDPFGPTAPLTINPNFVNRNKVVEEQVVIPEEKEVNYIKPEINNRFDFNSVREESEKIERPVVLEDKDATKVCSICGHRVSASLKTCPYCKRSF